jgi:hypothetical protein
MQAHASDGISAAAHAALENLNGVGLSLPRNAQLLRTSCPPCLFVLYHFFLCQHVNFQVCELPRG